MDFVLGNSNNLQKLSLEGKTSGALNMFTQTNGTDYATIYDV